MENEKKMAGIAFFLLLAGLVAAGLFIALFAELADEVMDKEFALFDVLVIGLLENAASGPLDTIMFVFTEMGSVWFLTTMSVIVVAVLALKMKDKWGVLFFVIAVGGGALLTTLLKNIFDRERPAVKAEIDAVGYSFPSGHSMGSLIFYGFVIFLVIRTRQKPWIQGVSVIILATLIVLIGISRIYLGAHFPSDVLAGYIAGTIWLVLSVIALEWIQWHSRSPVPPVHALRDLLVPLYKALKKKLPFFTN